jgi:hypothetical protein
MTKTHSVLLTSWLVLGIWPVSVQAETLTVTAPDNGSGLKLKLAWTKPATPPAGYVVLRSKSAQGPWSIAKENLAGTKMAYTDKVTTDTRKNPPVKTYYYRVLSLPSAFVAPKIKKATPPDKAEKIKLAAYEAAKTSEMRGSGDTVAHLFIALPGMFILLAIILAMGFMMVFFTRRVRAGHSIPIRRIPGIDAIEEGIGRATEMGKPVLYVPGIDSLEDIQTIASMLILGEISKTIAEYQADIIVSCCVPIVREVADEVVRSGYYRAGHPDAYDPTSVRFISNDQFAFCAGTNGIMHRTKPATNIYLGRFFAESLILAETGFVNESIQIAGTAEATQLPFFIAACDYTLIGEELFAVSAYLSQDARLVSSLKASDIIKVAAIILLVLGVAGTTLGLIDVNDFFEIAGG